MTRVVTSAECHEGLVVFDEDLVDKLGLEDGDKVMAEIVVGAADVEEVPRHE